MLGWKDQFCPIGSCKDTSQLVCPGQTSRMQSGARSALGGVRLVSSQMKVNKS